MEKTLAIYLGATRYVVADTSSGRSGLWAILGPDYDRLKAQELADRLNQERDELKEAKSNSRKELHEHC